MTATFGPGIYDMPANQYHRDPCVTPSASNSVLRTLMTQSPLHAKFSHPKLVADPSSVMPSRAMNFGTAVHELILGKGEGIVEVNFDDWRKKEAKALREAITEAGKSPLLSKDFGAAHSCAEKVIEQMKQHEECQDFFASGMSEAVAIWEEDGVLCRAMIDRLPNDPTAPIYDLKGTEMNINPQEWQRTFVKNYRHQERFYAMAMAKLRGKKPPSTRFITFEMQEPYAIAVFTSAPQLQHIAESELHRALRIWKHCLDHDDWFGYRGTAHVEPPIWLERQFDDQKLNDEFTGFHQ